MSDFRKTLEQVKAAQAALDAAKRAADEARKQLKDQAIAAIREIVRDAGLSKSDLKEVLSRGRFENKEIVEKKQPAVPRYRNPKDPSQTWTGQGQDDKMPEWIKEYRIPNSTPRAFRIEAWNPERPDYEKEKKRQAKLG